MQLLSVENRVQLKSSLAGAVYGLGDNTTNSASVFPRHAGSTSALPSAQTLSKLASTKSSISKSMLKLEAESAKRVPRAKKLRVEKIRHTQGGTETFLNDYDDRP